MKVKISELIGPALDWAVAKCEGISEESWFVYFIGDDPCGGPNYSYSTDWSQGGPIIERENIDIHAPRPVWPYWKAYKPEWDGGSGMMEGNCRYGSTPLIAAMRCYVASKLGDEVDVPEELL